MEKIFGKKCNHFWKKCKQYEVWIEWLNSEWVAGVWIRANFSIYLIYLQIYIWPIFGMKTILKKSYDSKNDLWGNHTWVDCVKFLRINEKMKNHIVTKL